MRILQDEGADVEPVFSFTSSLFHGASFNLNNATGQDISAIQNLPEVGNIWPAAYFTLGAEPQEILQDSSPLATWNPHSQTNVSQIHDLGNLGEGVVVAVVVSHLVPFSARYDEFKTPRSLSKKPRLPRHVRRALLPL